MGRPAATIYPGLHRVSPGLPVNQSDGGLVKRRKFVDFFSVSWQRAKYVNRGRCPGGRGSAGKRPLLTGGSADMTAPAALPGRFLRLGTAAQSRRQANLAGDAGLEPGTRQPSDVVAILRVPAFERSGP